MNAKNAASGATAATVPGALIVGAALIASSFAGLKAQRNHYQAEATQPRPTATVTAPPPARPAPGTTTAVARPNASPAPAATVIAVSESTAAVPRTASGGQRHTQARPPSSPQPTRTEPRATASASVRVGLTALSRPALTAGGAR